MHNNEFRGLFGKICAFLEIVLPVFFWVLLIYGFDDPATAGITVISALLHEGGHILCLLITSNGNFSARGVINGFRIGKRKLLSYKKEILLSLSGPLTNLAVGSISLLFVGIIGEYTQLFAVINFAAAVSNLLPVEGYDGYGVIKNFILLCEAGDFWEVCLDFLSFLITALLCFFSLYIMARCDGGYWIYAIFLVSLISKMVKSLKNVKFEI